MFLTVYGIILIFLATVFGDDPYTLPEDCTGFNPVKVIDREKLAGKWYILYQTINVPVHCEINIIDSLDPGSRTFNISSRAVKKGSNEVLNYVIEAELLKAANPEAEYLFFKSGYPVQLRLFLLNDNYEQFLAFYSCDTSSEYLLAYSRNTTVDYRGALDVLLMKQSLRGRMIAKLEVATCN